METAEQIYDYFSGKIEDIFLYIGKNKIDVIEEERLLKKLTKEHNISIQTLKRKLKEYRPEKIPLKFSAAIGNNIDFMVGASNFVEQNPVYYDNAGLWWLWDGLKWIMVDEIDILNAVYDAFEDSGITNQNVKAQFVTALKMIARINKPKRTSLIYDSYSFRNL